MNMNLNALSILLLAFGTSALAGCTSAVDGVPTDHSSGAAGAGAHAGTGASTQDGAGGFTGNGAGSNSGGFGNPGGQSGSGGTQSTGATPGAGGVNPGGSSAGGVQNSGGRGTTGGETGSGGTGNGGAAGGTGGGTGGATGGGTGDSCDATGFYVEGDDLYDSNCNVFLMRGVNYPYTWFKDSAAARFADVASVGANAIRVVLSTGGRWTRVSGSEVADVISWAKQNQMVAILEVHDSTGWSGQDGSVHAQDAVDYWLSDDIRAAIDGNEAYVVINIANEPFDNYSSDEWASFHEGAVIELRNAGVDHTLMVDAPHWGQDWQNMMRDGSGATQIFNADPEQNVVFSVHMYDVYNSEDIVWDYFTGFLDKGLPLVVGEFAADHGSGYDVVEAAIMDYATQLGVGYLGWSWSGNGEGLGSLDITYDFNVDNLSSWGDQLVNGPNGLQQTSEICTCFE